MSAEHIYIHWPFCKKKCWYCDFVSFEQPTYGLNPSVGEYKKSSCRWNHPIKQYHDALLNEIAAFAASKQSNGEKLPIKTLFLGGGTPSRYPLELLQKLFALLDKNFLLKNLQEATIESNPGDVTEEKLSAWRNLGINRLSIGVQILDEKILENVNRYQKNKSVIDLLSIAPNYFENISVDLILGLPGTTSNVWFDTLKYLISTPINHISVYFLTIYEKTPLYFKIQ